MLEFLFPKGRSRPLYASGGRLITGQWTSIASTETIPPVIEPVILTITTSGLLAAALGSADRSARFFKAAAALALPFSSSL